MGPEKREINKAKNVDINLIDFICFSKKSQPTRGTHNFFFFRFRFNDGKKII